MKKLALGLMVVALIVALSLSVMAGRPRITGELLPDSAVEHEAWKLDDSGNWIPMGVGGIEANARAFSSNPVLDKCNKIYWEIPVTVHASVAQWIEFSINGTRYDWRVRKPGTYAANSLTAWLKSNSDVEVDFRGFRNLKYRGSKRFPGVEQEIETWYAYGEGADPGDDNLTWIPAVELNGCDAVIKDSAGLHTGSANWKLWNKIRVTECNSACEYNDNAMITLVLQNQKIWIDPETGNFAQ